MSVREKLIHFQNQAERDFEQEKTVANSIKYFFAFILFMLSSMVAGLTMPFRILWKKLFANKSNDEGVSAIYKIDAQNAETILAENQLVLLDFWAEWCGPCLFMDPILERFLEESTANVALGKVNADSNKELLKKYKVRGLPQFILIKNGEEVKRHAGPMTSTELHAFVDLGN